MFYPNLEAEMKRKGYTRDDIAKVLDVHTLNSKAYQGYSSQRAADYREWVDTLEGYSGFTKLDDETKDKALDAAYSLSQHLALRDYSGGRFTDADLPQWERWASGGADWGVDETEAILFKVAYDMTEGDVGEDGKTISGSKKKNTLEAVDGLMPWLTDEELEYLMANYWTPEGKELKALKDSGFLP